MRQKAQENQVIQNTTGYVSNMMQAPSIGGANETIDGKLQQQQNSFQMNRLQYVQYECIKTELKEEYEKRVKFLNNRIEKRQAQQGPYQDAHLVLM